VPVYFLEAKQGYTVRKKKEDKWILKVLISTGKKFKNKKEVPVWYTGIYRPISRTG
jgi:hypothetical protein